jgi:hypothetical protein
MENYDDISFLSFFNLKKPPFSLVPDPGLFFFIKETFADP